MTQVRKVIEIDEDLCNGCGDCITGCPEGALQLVDGKAKLVADTYCDGLGACLGECPQGAIQVIEREAAPYDERLVMANIVKQGPAAVQQHLDHLKEHGEREYLAQAEAYLRDQEAPARSGLTHWPVQMHLINPNSPHFEGSDFLLSADCVAFTVGDFHSRHLRGKTLGIACPKLDDGREIYLEKLKALVEHARINTLTVMVMQVPCCQGLLRLAREAVSGCNRKVPIKAMVVSVKGDVLSEEWVS